MKDRFAPTIPYLGQAVKYHCRMNSTTQEIQGPTTHGTYGHNPTVNWVNPNLLVSAPNLSFAQE